MPAKFFGSDRWGKPAVKMLGELLARGLSSSQAARALSAHFGANYTRNAIIGKSKRLGFKLLGKPRAVASAGPTTPRVRREKAKRVAAVYQLIPGYRVDIPYVGEPIAAGDVSDGCRWMHGEPAAFNFCGAVKFHGSYCQHHYARVTLAPTKAQRKDDRRYVSYLARA